MYLYGICIVDIEHLKLDGIIELLKTVDIYKECMEDCDDDESYIFDWIENYDSNGRFGLGALLYDVITQKEKFNIDIDDPNGIVFIGLAGDAPWNFNKSTKNITEEDYNQMLRRYVNLITDDELVIRWWKENERDW